LLAVVGTHVLLAEVNWLAARAVLAKRMRRTWSGLKQAALLENVLVAMFQRQPVSPSHLLPGGDTLTYDWLEQHELGLRYDEHGAPYWPHLCLQAWIGRYDVLKRQYFRTTLDHALRASMDGEEFTWQQFERFCSQYLAVKLAAFADGGEIKLATLLRSALIATDLQERDLAIPADSTFARGAGRVKTAHKTVPRKVNLTDRGVPIRWRSTASVVLNQEGVPFNFFAQVSSPDFKRGYFLCGHTKYYTATRLTLAHITAALNKVRKAMKKAHFKNWMLLVITTAQFEGDAAQLPERCAVVSARQCAAFFTTPFTARALST
jgi:hypothetical protein